ncbi:Tim17-domain-containing protein, partial [Neoconidiobolus thromboides FSU 785]
EPQTISSILGQVPLDTNRLHPIGGLNQDAIEYIRLEEGNDATTAFGFIPSRSASDDILFGTGATYLAGLTLGGAYGIIEGYRSTRGSPFKLRYNGMLNGCTRRGPFIGNSMGMLGLGYNIVNSLLVRQGGAADDIYTSAGAGFLVGFLFKSTAGLRSAGVSGAICGTVIGLWKMANEQFQKSS